MLAGALIALMLEPTTPTAHLLLLDGLAEFELGRSENASDVAINRASRLRALGQAVRRRGDEGFGGRGIGSDVRKLIQSVEGLALTGDPMTDWRAVRAAFAASLRTQLQAVAKEARHMQLLRRGAQIESRFAEAWRNYGVYRDARAMLNAAVVEDQFAATTRPHRGATVMTIARARRQHHQAGRRGVHVRGTGGQAGRRPCHAGRQEGDRRDAIPLLEWQRLHPHFVHALPEDSRLISFGPDPNNIGVMQTRALVSHVHDAATPRTGSSTGES